MINNQSKNNDNQKQRPLVVSASQQHINLTDPSGPASQFNPSRKLSSMGSNDLFLSNSSSQSINGQKSGANCLTNQVNGNNDKLTEEEEDIIQDELIISQDQLYIEEDIDQESELIIDEDLISDHVPNNQSNEQIQQLTPFPCESIPLRLKNQNQAQASTSYSNSGLNEEPPSFRATLKQATLMVPQEGPPIEMLVPPSYHEIVPKDGLNLNSWKLDLSVYDGTTDQHQPFRMLYLPEQQIKENRKSRRAFRKRGAGNEKVSIPHSDLFDKPLHSPCFAEKVYKTDSQFFVKEKQQGIGRVSMPPRPVSRKGGHQKKFGVDKIDQKFMCTESSVTKSHTHLEQVPEENNNVQQQNNNHNIVDRSNALMQLKIQLKNRQIKQQQKYFDDVLKGPIPGVLQKDTTPKHSTQTTLQSNTVKLTKLSAASKSVGRLPETHTKQDQVVKQNEKSPTQHANHSSKNRSTSDPKTTEKQQAKQNSKPTSNTQVTLPVKKETRNKSSRKQPSQCQIGNHSSKQSPSRKDSRLQFRVNQNSQLVLRQNSNSSLVNDKKSQSPPRKENGASSSPKAINSLNKGDKLYNNPHLSLRQYCKITLPDNPSLVALQKRYDNQKFQESMINKLKNKQVQSLSKESKNSLSVQKFQKLRNFPQSQSNGAIAKKDSDGLTQSAQKNLKLETLPSQVTDSCKHSSIEQPITISQEDQMHLNSQQTFESSKFKQFLGSDMASLGNKKTKTLPKMLLKPSLKQSVRQERPLTGGVIRTISPFDNRLRSNTPNNNQQNSKEKVGNFIKVASSTQKHFPKFNQNHINYEQFDNIVEQESSHQNQHILASSVSPQRQTQGQKGQINFYGSESKLASSASVRNLAADPAFNLDQPNSVKQLPQLNNFDSKKNPYASQHQKRILSTYFYTKTINDESPQPVNTLMRPSSSASKLHSKRKLKFISTQNFLPLNSTNATSLDQKLSVLSIGNNKELMQMAQTMQYNTPFLPPQSKDHVPKNTRVRTHMAKTVASESKKRTTSAKPPYRINGMVFDNHRKLDADNVLKNQKITQ